MKYILAIDSFKGSLSSADVEDTMAKALIDKGEEVISLPMSDGGEGMLQAFTSALKGKFVEVATHDAMMRRITARYGITEEGTAIIETSESCGLTLMKEEERNPMVATTYGVGEILLHAIRNGCKNFIIGLGGSGTSDAGIGMLKALVENAPQCDNIDDVLKNVLKDCHFTLACDVRNPLYGENGAAHTFGKQKGATEEMIEKLDNRARRFAEISARHFHHDMSNNPGAGAAGGLGYAFMQYLGATTQSGADLLLDLMEFDKLITDVDIIITGEGKADNQTLMGKLPERVLRRAQLQGKPTWLVAGSISDKSLFLSAGFAKVESITPQDMPLLEAIKPEVARKNILRWVQTTTT